MSNIQLTLTDAEAACICGAVRAELHELQMDLKNSNISKSDKLEIQNSVEACTSILIKLSTADPNAIYL
ncbi:MAG: hypothetical protein E7262_09555 [Lachnospiraceae bacterium]|nr:hypothetical protein [Lachnospiraceae bacterium]